ncbi:phage tail assembly protein [Wolbachia endosymbiont of Folsomia candida]|uniref:phage tail assembly protein n=1 Tax=Wolbachia endosymbiont of Folsomia candida TaxID=169402 RepID=UPI000B127A71|nr:phage tail assembly protein [Wolbachia endosymbiont of Folsomia candida]APR98631.1 phage tail assembly protein [Wolbachia endosymbiont of Folsomia candida]
MQTITLTEPITINGIAISELSMRKPKVRDLLAIDRIEGEALKEVALIANLVSVPKEAIEELEIADYVKVQKVLKDFLSPLEQKA